MRMQDNTDIEQNGNASHRVFTGCSRSWFFSFSSVASSQTGRSEYDNLFPGGASPSAEAPAGRTLRA